MVKIPYSGRASGALKIKNMLITSVFTGNEHRSAYKQHTSVRCRRTCRKGCTFHETRFSDTFSLSSFFPILEPAVNSDRYHSMNAPMYQRKTNSSNGGSSMYSRGNSGGYGRDVEGGGGRFNDANTNILEQQNNDRISELSEQVARLKVRWCFGCFLSC